MSTEAILFVYNADSGVFNTLADTAHKLLSPKTYSCNLCAVTYATFGMRGAWKTYIEGLSMPVEFLYRDEFRRRYAEREDALPAVFRRTAEGLEVLLDAATLDAVESIDDLREQVGRALERAIGPRLNP